MPEPIFEPGPVATPFVYTVSGTGEVVPRTCQAVYNGSGAAGNYVPAVIFRSQAGHVISRAILQSTVTAGDDAEVSWFPHVGGAVSSSGTPSLPVAFVDFTTPLTLNTWGGIFTAVTWELILTDAASSFTWPSGGDSTKVNLTAPGVYRLVYQWKISTLNYPAAPGLILSTVNTTVFSATTETLSANATTAALTRGDPTTGTPWGPMGERVFNITAARDVRVLVAWTGAGSVTLSSMVAFIYRLGDVLA